MCIKKTHLNGLLALDKLDGVVLREALTPSKFDNASE